jgi:uncharacterized protein YecE (DUF72 family)
MRRRPAKPYDRVVTVFIGTSGWQYKDWRSAFYPAKLAQKGWLQYYAQRFQVVEVNNTFYNLPDADVFRSWRAHTPEDFVFVPKMSRYLTHMKRLREPEAALERFFSAAGELQHKLGPVLLQLPPRMKSNPERLRATLRAFPEHVRVAVEFRDDSWFGDDVRSVLSEYGAALCLADRGEKLGSPDWRTADWGYVRFHWGNGTPESSYSESCLQAWAFRLQRLWNPNSDVYVFFNNDPHCCAVNDAGRLALELKSLGLETSRTP